MGGTGRVHDNMTCMPAAAASSSHSFNFLIYAMAGHAWEGLVVHSIICNDVYFDENENLRRRNVHVFVIRPNND